MRHFVSHGVRSVLVMRLYFVGDVLLSTPVLAALRRGLPGARIDVLVKRRAAGVLERNPHLDRVLLYDEPDRYHSPLWLTRLALNLRRTRYDLAVDLTGDHRSSLLLAVSDPGFRTGVNHCGMGFLLDRRVPYESEGHVVDHLLKTVEVLGIEPGVRSPVLELCEDEIWESRRILEDAGIDTAGPFALLSPGGNWPPRRWPAERFGALAAALRGRLGVVSAVAGGRDDIELAETVAGSSEGAARSIAGRTTVRTLAGCAALASLFVGNDSGPLHIAASQGTPVVGLFGPNTPDRFAPRGAPSRILWTRYPCSPCRQRRCVSPTGPCMEAIGVEEAYEASSSLLVSGRSRC